MDWIISNHTLTRINPSSGAGALRSQKMSYEFPLAEDFSRYADTLLSDESFNPSTLHQTKITTTLRVSKKSKPKKHRTKPCNNCRKRKTKCTTLPGQPKCIECTKRELECSHNETDDTSSTAKASCDNCSHRRTKCIIPEDSSICTECSLRDLSCKFTQPIDESEVKIRKSTPVLDYDEYVGPTILRKTLSLQGPKSSQLQSPNSTLEKNLLRFGSDDGNGSSIDQYLSPTSAYLNNEQLVIDQSIKLRKINDNSFFKIIKDNEEFIKLNHSQVDEIEQIVYPHGLTLVKLFCNHIHPLIPILSKNVIFEKYARSHREFDPLILIMIYLHALKLWSHTKLPMEDKPDIDKLERLSIVLYSENLANLNPKFSICQAIVLLIHYNPQSSELKPIINIKTKDDKWEKLSRLITMVEELGLNHNSDDWYTIPNWERKLRKLLAWGVIMVDKFQAMIEFKPSKINSNDWILNELNVEDFQDDDDTELESFLDIFNTSDPTEATNESSQLLRDQDKTDPELVVLGNLIFVKMIHLSYHVNDSLTEIFNLKSVKFDDFGTLMAKSNKLLQNLDNWYATLPDHLKSMTVYSSFISTGSLNLSYHLVNFLIYRRIINHFIDNYAQFLIIDEVLVNFKPFFKKMVKHLIKFNDIFMKDLSLVHLTNCFWYGMKSNSFINIAIVIQLLMKISRMELYIDDEYTLQDLTNIWLTYITKLQEMGDAGDKELSDVVKHIDMFVVPRGGTV